MRKPFAGCVVLLLVCPPSAWPAKASNASRSAETTDATMVVPAVLDQIGPPGPFIPNGQALVNEVEPNNSPATATPLGGLDVVALGNNFPNGDDDYYSFTGTLGDRVYAATQTLSSASSGDTVLTLLTTDGTTVLEEDDGNGSLGPQASSIAGAILPVAGTFYLRVRVFTAGTQIRPYHLHLRVRSGVPTPETEPNDATPQALPPSGWVTGATSAASDVDSFSFTLNAGETAYLSLDLDPERDTVQWDGRLSLGLFANTFLVVDDLGLEQGPDSEAFLMTVHNPGTYVARVAVAAGGPGTYHLSVSVHPAETESCTTFPSAAVPVTIGPGSGTVTSTLIVPGNPRIGDLDVNLDIDMSAGTGLLQDLDVTLVAPAGNEVALFTDVGSSGAGQFPSMNLALDDEAGSPPAFLVLDGMRYQPESAYRLDWFDGEDAGGTWTLRITDDTTNTSGGTLNAWSLRVCPPSESCPVQTVIYAQDFEASDGGYTHGGVADEWAWGTPSGGSLPITTCNSGTRCWKTDLTGTYNASSNEDLRTVPISLTGVTGTLKLRWAMKYQMENASFDNAWVEVRQAGGANPRRVWEWLGPIMTTVVGAVTVQESAGWGLHEADISAYAGQNIEVVFHLNSDVSGQLSGIGIDDVTVVRCDVPVELLGFTVG